MQIAVTGGAGFIGSNLVDALLAAGHGVVVLDDFRTGTRDNLTGASRHPSCVIVETDLLTDPLLADSLSGVDAVFHLAANADVRYGWEAPRRDLEQNVVVTLNVLDAMRAAGVPRIVFSSTGSVYGEATQIPTPEDAAFPAQTSLYGASKLAAEGYLGAYAEARQVSATVFRFVSIVGRRYSHGHVIDFVRQLHADSSRLRVLGDGWQRKSYLDVDDCTKALTAALERDPGFEVYNLGGDDYCTVRDSIAWICERMGVEPTLHFDDRDRGWVGDNPFIFLDTARIRAAGWEPRYSIREGIERTVDDLLGDIGRIERTEARIHASSVDGVAS